MTEDPMKVLCISNDDGKYKDTYLKCKNPEEYIPDWCIFITLEQWRNIQVNKILCK